MAHPELCARLSLPGLHSAQTVHGEHSSVACRVDFFVGSTIHWMSLKTQLLEYDHVRRCPTLEHIETDELKLSDGTLQRCGRSHNLNGATKECKTHIMQNNNNNNDNKQLQPVAGEIQVC